jgi:hypothetical protein
MKLWELLHKGGFWMRLLLDSAPDVTVQYACRHLIAHRIRQGAIIETASRSV